MKTLGHQGESVVTTLYVDMELLASQTKDMAEQCIIEGHRHEWYEGLAGMLAEIEHTLSQSGELLLTVSNGGE